MPSTAHQPALQLVLMQPGTQVQPFIWHLCPLYNCTGSAEAQAFPAFSVALTAFSFEGSLCMRC